MLKVQNIKALGTAGFGMGELGIFQGSDEKAEQALRYISEGLTKDQIVDYIKGEMAQSMTTRKNLKKGEVDPNPENVLEVSSSVLNAEINFGGIKNAEFIDWNGVSCLKNAGTGRTNSLFLPMSAKLKGKIDATEARARIENTKRLLYEHITVLEIVDAYFKGQAEKMGVDSTVA